MPFATSILVAFLVNFYGTFVRFNGIFSVILDGTETMRITPLKITQALLNPNALAAVSNCLWAVKLCTDKIIQFLTASTG